ncbi:hypothetical protein RFI_00637 [Reticulomyxa filosa]|uniref:Uncharacterized protein n=1 Tax=Reticulomyxa filosa TaxID=46433 RepID=X6PFI8_RETFI|nr:hypothetical protein RFI_00637 [Reticulomyxa filosa]|eukprot:ETO36427.1 hypothetical protein RFI_00637 [Reticulomyxa filosa]
MTLMVKKAQSVTVIINKTIENRALYAMNYGALNINDSQNVYLSCNNPNTCLYTEWNLYGNDNVSIVCNGYYACYESRITIGQSQQVMFQVTSLTVQGADGAILNNWYYLTDIERFLLDIAGTGNTLGTAWSSDNVSSVAIGNWNVTSYWLTSKVADAYQCPNDRDCHIRVDTAMGKYVNISCPSANRSSSTDGNQPKCLFYCTANGGCNGIRLFAIDSPYVTLFFNPTSNSGFFCQFFFFCFSLIFVVVIVAYVHYMLLKFCIRTLTQTLKKKVNANGSGLNEYEGVINISCNTEYSCRRAVFQVSRYATPTVSCNAYMSCESTQFNISNFHNYATIMSSNSAMYEATLSLWSGSTVFAASKYSSGAELSFYNTFWSFDDIDQVDMICEQNSDCLEAKFNVSKVNQMRVVCNSNSFNSGENCRSAKFDVDQYTDFDLTCAGFFSCFNMSVWYDASQPYYHRCDIGCYFNSFNQDAPSCDTVNIIVENNQIGYQVISLWCQIIDDNQACNDVTVQCGDSELMCTCPVLYDSKTGICVFFSPILFYHNNAFCFDVSLRILGWEQQKKKKRSLGL